MYRILNKLFGWDYVLWRNLSDCGVSKIISSKDGRIGYWRYKIPYVFDEIKNPEQVFWLTCNPSKYFKNLNNK